jgi:hypothetical protein
MWDFGSVARSGQAKGRGQATSKGSSQECPKSRGRSKYDQFGLGQKPGSADDTLAAQVCIDQWSPIDEEITFFI